jgi:predicted solute-binding protein
MSQSPIKNSISLSEVSLHDIAELINLFGGSIQTRAVSDDVTPFISMYTQVGNCQVFAYNLAKNIAVMNQQSAFGGLGMAFPSGSNLTVIDDQYLVLSDSNG